MKTHAPQVLAAAFTVCLLFLAHQATAATDQTLVASAAGSDVVDAVVDKIHRSNIFPDDYDFLKRIAYVESKYGTANTTFRPSFFGGIWQLNDRRYNATKSQNLATIHQSINTVFGANWTNTAWTDLLKPLHSGLGMRIFLSSLNMPIPQTLKAQADYWNDYLNAYDDMNATHFVEQVTELENITRCNGKMDLLVVLDESGSIGQADYDKALGFVGNLFGSYSLDNVREGFLTFATDVRQHFPIQNNLTAPDIQKIVNETSYASQNTFTSKALKAAAELFNNTQERSGVPKVMTLFTDGQSTDGLGVGNSALLKAIDVVSFAIGIGKYELAELEEIAYGDKAHVFTLDDFDALQEFFGRLNSETCAVPQKPELNETTADSLTQNERRVYSFQVPAEGITIFLESSVGRATGYFSYTYPKPSPALNDGVLSDETFIASPNAVNIDRTLQSIFARAGENSTSVYLTIEGLEAKNDYTVQAAEGNLVPEEESTTEGSAFQATASILMCVCAYIFSTVFAPSLY